MEFITEFYARSGFAALAAPAGCARFGTGATGFGNRNPPFGFPTPGCMAYSAHRFFEYLCMLKATPSVRWQKPDAISCLARKVTLGARVAMIKARKLNALGQK